MNALIPRSINSNLNKSDLTQSITLSVYNPKPRPSSSESSSFALNSQTNRYSNCSSYTLHDSENAQIIHIKNNHNLLANLKNAFMLFVVTIIMAFVYTPAILTSLGFIRYNPIHWNMIYINNAANPIVYSFMNKKFRMTLRKKLKSYSKD